MLRKKQTSSINRLAELIYLFNILTRATDSAVYYYGAAPVAYTHLADLVCIELCKELNGNMEVLNRLRDTTTGSFLYSLEKYISSQPHLQHLKKVFEAPDTVDKLLAGIKDTKPSSYKKQETESERLDKILDDALKSLGETKKKRKRGKRHEHTN